MEYLKKKGAYFEGSDKKYPNIELPNWMRKSDEEEENEDYILSSSPSK